MTQRDWLNEYRDRMRARWIRAWLAAKDEGRQITMIGGLG